MDNKEKMECTWCTREATTFELEGHLPECPRCNAVRKYAEEDVVTVGTILTFITINRLADMAASRQPNKIN